MGEEQGHTNFGLKRFFVGADDDGHLCGVEKSRIMENMNV